MRPNKWILMLAAILSIFLIRSVNLAQQTITWTTQADAYRGRNGQQLTFICPGGGSISSRVWGTNVYTDDSPVCTAAVHAGFINVINGGRVTIEIRPGASSYESTTRNGVTTKAYGAWPGSFVLVR